MKREMGRVTLWLLIGGAAAVSLATSIVWAQSVASVSTSVSSAQPADEDMGGFGNPASFAVENGKQLWSDARGPKHVSLAKTCNLGLGAGVIKGAYAELPRYFSDTDKVQDLESRLLTCMVDGQGLDRETIVKNLHSAADGSLSDMASIVVYVAEASKGMPINVSLKSPQEKQAYEVGKQIFYYKFPPYDFSCSTCHMQNGKRVRLSSVPNLSVAGRDAQKSYAIWPAYRLSKGEVVTYEMRLLGCFRQTRAPELKYGSPAAIDLSLFLARNANGGKMAAPGLTQ